MDKKEKERECLDQVIKIGFKQRGQTKRIIKRISGKDFERDYEERPDFVKYCPPNNKGEKGTLIGIEHFRVDHFVLKKQDGKVASTGATILPNIYKTYTKWRDEVLESNTIPKGAIESIMDNVVQQLKLKSEATYKNFIASFQYSLCKHTDCIDTYCENLEKMSKGKYKIEIGFLIEIHSDFSNLFIDDKKGTRRKTNGHMPMFADVVRILEEKFDNRKVDFIVFCIGDVSYYKEIEIIAVNTKDIRKQLEQHNIRIYEYIGEDIFLDEFQPMHKDIEVLPRYYIKNENIDFNFTISMNDLSEEMQIQLMLHSCKKAKELLLNGHNIITTLGTQMLLDCLSEYIAEWKTVKSDEYGWMIFPIFIPVDKQIIYKKLNEFMEKWSEKGEQAP